MRHFLPKQSLQAILDSFAAIGLDVAPIANGFWHRDDANPEDWGVMASVDALMTLWQNARKQSQEPHLFVRAGLAAPVGCFGIIDHLVFLAATLEEGMECLREHITLVSSTSVLSFAEDDDIVEVQMLNRPHLPIHDLVDQWLLGLFTSRYRQIFGAERPLASLMLRSLQVRDPSLDSLLGARVVPHPAHTGMRICRDVWKMPLPDADPALHKSLQKVASELVQQRFSSAPLAFAVWNALSEVLHAEVSVSAAVAEKLGVSSRTLQRRLQKEHFSMSRLLEAYRKQEAMRMLSEGVLSIADIAFQLGYNEQSSFNRSFKRWMGVSPRKWLQSVFSREPSPQR